MRGTVRGCCGRPCPPLISGDQLTYIRGTSVSRTTTLRHTTERKELVSQTNIHHLHINTFTYNICMNINIHLYIFSSIVPLNHLSLSLGNLSGFFIPRKPRGSQSRQDWGSGPTPDALLLAPRATERFLRPVKPAGCAQGSKIQQIPGQLSGDSYFVNGHTEPKTL